MRYKSSRDHNKWRHSARPAPAPCLGEQECGLVGRGVPGYSTFKWKIGPQRSHKITATESTLDSRLWWATTTTTTARGRGRAMGERRAKCSGNRDGARNGCRAGRATARPTGRTDGRTERRTDGPKRMSTMSSTAPSPTTTTTTTEQQQQQYKRNC